MVAARLSGSEACNCGDHDPAGRDVHVWLAASPEAAKADAVVVELTPRLRALHPEWTMAWLHGLQRARVLVRVSGWLMLDEEHPELVGKERAGLWEIHPVMGLEVVKS